MLGGEKNTNSEMLYAHGRSLLAHAASDGNVDLVNLLLSHQADPNLKLCKQKEQGNCDETVVQAIINSRNEITSAHNAALSLIIESGMDTQRKDSLGNLPVFYVKKARKNSRDPDLIAMEKLLLR